MTVHLEYTARGCNCGDSYCGDCRTTNEVILCGARTHPEERARQMDQVTCKKCKAEFEFRMLAAVQKGGAGDR